MNRWVWPAMAALGVMAVSPAYAIDLDRSVETDAAPAVVWTAIGDFCGIGEWHSAVTACETTEEGGTTTRTLTLADGATLVEELVSRDDAAMTYTYRIIEGPLPVANYESTLAVEAAGEGSRITWNGTFDASGATDEEASAVIGGIYDAGLQGIVERAAM